MGILNPSQHPLVRGGEMQNVGGTPVVALMLFNNYLLGRISVLCRAGTGACPYIFHTQSCGRSKQRLYKYVPGIPAHTPTLSQRERVKGT